MNTSVPPLHPDPEDSQPIVGVSGLLEALLRRPRQLWQQLGHARSPGLMLGLLTLTLVATLLYGVVVGSFSGGTQWWAAPLKVTVGLLACGLLCLPSLYVFACLSGARVGLLDAVGLVVGLLALFSVLLMSFAPVAWIFSESTQSVAAMGALHLLFCLTAIAFGVRFLHQGLVHRGAPSSAALAVWSVLFVLVMLQMMTALRPLVGTADTLLPVEKRFFLQHWVKTLNPDSGN